MSVTLDGKRIIARGIVIREGRALLAFNKKDDFYFLPGGHVELGEACSDALLREIEEETTLKASSLSPPTLVGVFENVWSDGGTDVFELLICFETELDVSIPSDSVESREVHLSFHFLSVEDLQDVVFQPAAMKQMVLHALNLGSQSNSYYKLGEGEA